jgi:hypothetical protein
MRESSVKGARVFVVRVIGRDKLSDYKVFEDRWKAEDHFWATLDAIEDIEGATSALFKVHSAIDQPEAVYAVKEDRSDVELLQSRPAPIRRLRPSQMKFGS